MKKIFFFLALLALIQKQTNAQPLAWDSAKKGSCSYNALGNATTVDVLGNVFVAGFYGGTNFTLGASTLANSSSGGMFLIKYDPSGNMLWAKTQAGAGAASITGIATDSNSNVFITGAISTQSVIIDTYTLNCLGVNDIFVVKYDQSGTVLWAKSAGGTNSDYGKGISVDPSGNAFVTGYFRSPTLIFGTQTLTCPSGSNDILTLKYDPNGNELWAAKAGGNNLDEGRSITTDNNGNAIVTGIFSSPSTTFGTYTLTNSGFIVKYDPNGGVIWAKPAGSTPAGCIDISSDSNGNIFLTGVFSGTSIAFGTHTLTASNPPGTSNMFVAKYDALGNALWAKKIGNGFPAGICMDAIGNIYIAGSFDATLFNFGTAALTNNGARDIFVAKYDANGNELTAISAGGNLNEGASAIAADLNGNIYVIGDFESPALTFGAATLNNLDTNFTDVFIARLVLCAAAPLSPIDITSLNNKNICDASSATLSVTATGVVNWYASQTSTLSLANTYSYITPNLSVGTYTYYAEAYTCTNSISRTAITLTVDACTSIANLTNTSSIFSIYPNPFSDKLMIVSRELVLGNISIINSLGETILQKNKHDTSQYLDVSKLPSGIYFLKVEIEKKQSVFKIIKE